jgi:hypothetical protein
MSATLRVINRGLRWRISNHCGQPSDDPYASPGGRQHHHAAVAGEASGIAGGDEPFVADGWKAERLNRIVVHSGCGPALRCEQDDFDTKSIKEISVLCDIRPGPQPCGD